MPKLTPTNRENLEHIAKHGGELPAHYLNRTQRRMLTDLKMIEAVNAAFPNYRIRITDAGREALAQEKK